MTGPTVTRRPRGAVAALGAALGMTSVLATGCGSSGESVDTGRTPKRTVAGPAATTRHTESSGDRLTDTTEGSMRIVITLGDRRFGALLRDSAASRDLLGQLPLTVDMVDHGGVEKTGPLPSPLSLAGQPAGADPDVGDVGYYAPGNDLVLYYGDQSYYPGIVVVGRLDEGAAEEIARRRGPVTATVEAG